MHLFEIETVRFCVSRHNTCCEVVWAKVAGSGWEGDSKKRTKNTVWRKEKGLNRSGQKEIEMGEERNGGGQTESKWERANRVQNISSVSFLFFFCLL